MNYLVAFLVEADNEISLQQLLTLKEELEQDWAKDKGEGVLVNLLVARGKKAKRAFEAAELKVHGND